MTIIDEIDTASGANINKEATDVLAKPLTGDFGVVQTLNRKKPAPDDPDELVEYVVHICNTKPLSFFGKGISTAGGIATRPDEAKRKAVGEAIERYCLSIVKESELELSPAADVNGAVDPERFNNQDRELDPENEYYWTEVHEYSSRDRRKIPAELVYVPSYSPGKFIRSPISTGASCHLSPRAAFESGILEIVERDAYMINYLNALQGRQLRVEEVDSPRLLDLAETFSAHQFDVDLFYLTLDIPVHVVLCILWDEALDYFQMGMSADFDLGVAAYDAVVESYQGRPWIREADAKRYPPVEITSFERRAQHWKAKRDHDGIRHWLDGEPISIEQTTSVDTFESLLEVFEERGFDIFIKDITTEAIAEYGFDVVRTVIPDFHPMYLDENYRYVAGKRLFDAPVKSGLIDDSRSRDELNTIPHPFI